MSYELFYTSAPKGLRPGSRGFCTVAATQGLPLPVAEKVESLSGYRPLYPPLDPKANLNPIVHSHLRISAGGKTYSVLSRISSAGLDYSQRANKFAHHILLETGELPAGGPAWLLSQPGFMQSQWDGEVRVIPSGRLPPNGDGALAVCRHWQQLTGDAGWGGVLADWFERDSHRQIYVILEPGQDLLPLLAETIALLPVERRWQVTFSTYFTGMPQGIPCLWRCVVKDSPEAKTASRLPSQNVLNLCEPLGPAPEGKLVDQARSGRKAARVTVPEKEPMRTWPGQSDLGVPPDVEGIASVPLGRKQTSYGLEPIQKNQGFPQKASPRAEPLSRVGSARLPATAPPTRKGKKTLIWAALAGLICGIGMGTLAALLLFHRPSPDANSPKFISSDGERSALLASNEEEIKTLRTERADWKNKIEARDKEFQEVNVALAKTKKALEKETERRVQLETEKKEKEKTIAELRDELRKEEQNKEIPGGAAKAPAGPVPADGYLRLPEWSKSSINESKLRVSKDVKSWGLEPGNDYNLRLLVNDPSPLQASEGISSLKISLKGGKELAKFELKAGRLSFQWFPQAEDEYDNAQALLRDGVLEIGSAGKTRHIALRAPVGREGMDVSFPVLGRIGGTQEIYRNTGDFLPWDYQGQPSQELLFDLVRIAIDNREHSQQNRGEKKPTQTLLMEDASKQFNWGVIGKSQDGKHVGSLTLGPSNLLRKPSKARILSLAAYIEVHGVYVEVARIGKSEKK